MKKKYTTHHATYIVIILTLCFFCLHGTIDTVFSSVDAFVKAHSTGEVFVASAGSSIIGLYKALIATKSISHNDAIKEIIRIMHINQSNVIKILQKNSSEKPTKENESSNSKKTDDQEIKKI